METLHTRLDPIKGDVLKFTKLFGPWPAMDEYGVSDYVRFKNWLKEVTGDENFGLYPHINLTGGQRILNQVAIKVVRSLLELQVENERLREENKLMKAQLSRENGSDYQGAMALLEVCQV